MYAIRSYYETGLDEGERKLLCDIVYNLRMAYVNKSK